jgi:uncharacterized protein
MKTPQATRVKGSKVAIRLGLVVWGTLLLGLTSLGIVWLNVTDSNPATDFSPAIILVSYSPSLAAIGAAALIGRGVGPLFKQMLVWRINTGWYLLALLGPLALVGAAHTLASLFSGEYGADWHIPNATEIGGLMGPLIAGSLGEELGWRGYAQPRLQRLRTILGASIIIGIFWATWHLWPILAPGGSDSFSALDCIQTYVRLISTAVLYGWLYNATKGSLLLVMLAHAGHNIAVELLPIPSGGASAPALAVAFFYAAAAIGLVWGTRKRLTTRPNAV